MKLSKFLVVSAGLFLVLASSLISRSLKRRKDDKKCKYHSEDCVYKSVGSECCEGMYCDVYHFSKEEQGWKHYDITKPNNGKCKLKQDQKCYKSEQNPVPCKHDLYCYEYLYEPSSGTHCIPRAHDVKKLD